jgi:hypothetical protein
VQVSENVAFEVSGEVAWLPLTALLPDHAPLAVHADALLLFHVKVDVPPLAT